MPNHLVGLEANDEETDEEVENGQDNLASANRFFRLPILDDIAGIEAENVNCNECHYFVDDLQDVSLS